MFRLTFKFLSLSLALNVGAISLAAQSITSAVWNTATTGTIGTTDITISGLVGSGFFEADLTTSDFSFAPQSATEQTVSFDTLSDWTVTLSEPGDLYLYAIWWRGYEWEFDHEFSVVSGLTNINMPTSSSFQTTGGWGNGILLFENVSSLTLSTSNSDNSGQVMTFGLATASAVPEPSSYGLLAGAAMGLVGMTRRRKLRSPQAEAV
ncbi:PEP-CTERM sorting domain-containing protein [Synoicihabitans lomoniglobus]|uniref:PEP-CTERM sorting domain-containing protein n=1 Tax=Synoicihabitans lomoniglobus TaxID=2909285 RepID=A0AAF0I5E1_9BACT|nr:PEP-CTERM sorting domain-containing protein [Opitutaceae bacterium LMO-M01]WED67303.1 PEP-CTERM sorting domain-containing protein [Opitutaceae bacterium LMO-M01]